MRSPLNTPLEVGIEHAVILDEVVEGHFDHVEPEAAARVEIARLVGATVIGCERFGCGTWLELSTGVTVYLGQLDGEEPPVDTILVSWFPAPFVELIFQAPKSLHRVKASELRLRPTTP